MLLFISAVLVVLVVSFLCSIFESVLLSLTRPQIEVMIRNKQRAGHLLAGFKQNMDVPIAAVLILNTSAHTVGAAVAGASYSSVFDASTLWIFSILFTLAVLLFTEIIPKTLGVTYAAALATPVAHGIQWLSSALKPLVLLSEKISRSLRGNIEAPVTTPEEIRLLAILGSNEGVVGIGTASMIVGATQLRHLQAHDIMLPSEDVRFLSGTMSREQAMQLIKLSGHSRFPFSPTHDLNDVTGMILAKDLLYWLLTNDTPQIDWEALRQDLLIVPPSKSLPKLMQTYKETYRHLAVVVDEYGSVRGIVTLEDVLEEIVGDIRDESDSLTDDFVEREDGSLLVRATVDLRRLSVKLAVPWEPGVIANTVGGLITEQLERIPTVGDAISWRGYRLEVLRADSRRVRHVIIRKE
ncbi:MAG: HlyC/CorC family transporter [Gammaproteobacteria bacterium]|nr:HlyC/CorC family transporter [Gammaproteobacteria bacterium]